MKLFPTEKKEIWKHRIVRWVGNLTPIIRTSKGKLCFISDDYREAHVSLKHSLSTKNLVGATFGGVLFSAADPWHALLVYKILGGDYIIWDRSAEIRFLRPGKSRLKMKILITDQDILEIKEDLKAKQKSHPSFDLEWLDKNNKVVARLKKTLYVAEKGFHAQKLKEHSPSN
ncbi:MAG: DUF4442 domain-containing protein [Bacteroidota bacterium]